ncbi:hypothetical protein CBS147332_3040 [Penicillium roqueforti]|nr:hypothetical protein CBS147332_3040 [Penicillium roqueforti]KAI3125448.1 hypothetical protein CBS147331_442 [Penicillium roqueforti]
MPISDILTVPPQKPQRQQQSIEHPILERPCCLQGGQLTDLSHTSFQSIIRDPYALHDMAKDQPYGSLFPENGGYYLKDKDDGVFGIASYEPCTELDAAFASAEAKYAQEEAAESPAPTS